MAEKLRALLINPPRVKGLPVVREERYEHRDVGSVYPPFRSSKAPHPSAKPVTKLRFWIATAST